MLYIYKKQKTIRVHNPVKTDANEILVSSFHLPDLLAYSFNDVGGDAH